MFFKRLLLLDEEDCMIDYMAFLFCLHQKLQDGFECAGLKDVALNDFGRRCIEMFCLFPPDEDYTDENASSRLPVICIPRSLYVRTLLAVALLETAKQGYPSHCGLIGYVFTWSLFADL